MEALAISFLDLVLAPLPLCVIAFFFSGFPGVDIHP